MKAMIANLSLPGVGMHCGGLPSASVRARSLSASCRGLVVLVAIAGVGFGSVAVSAAPVEVGVVVSDVNLGADAPILNGADRVATTSAAASPSVGPKAGLLPVSCLVLVGAAGEPGSRSGRSPGYSRTMIATCGAIAGFVAAAGWMIAKSDSRSPLMGIQYEAVPIVAIGAGAVQGMLLGTPGITSGVDGGVAGPTGDLGMTYKQGFQAGVFNDHAFARQFAVGVGFDFVSMGGPSSTDEIDMTDESGMSLGKATMKSTSKMSIASIGGYAKWMPRMKGPASPYAQLGGGYYSMTETKNLTVETPDSKLSQSESRSEFWPGVFGGVGVDFKASPTIKVGAFAKFHNILSHGESLRYYNMGVSTSFGLASK
jgi:hypothetical protein